jgi:AraC-like DNA-binding protein
MSNAAQVPYVEVGTHVSADKQVGLHDYIHAISPVFDTRVEACENEVSAWIRSYNVGAVVLGNAHMSGTTYHYSRSDAKIAETALDLVLVQIIHQGSDIRRATPDEVVTTPGDVCLLDLTRTFSSEAMHCTNYNIAFPRALMGLSDVDMDALHGVVIRGSTASGALINSHIQTIWEQAGRITLDEAPAIAMATIDLIAALAAPNIEMERKLTAVGNAQITRIRRHIDDNLAQTNLGPDVLCKKFAVSRAALYRLFSPLGGVSEYIRIRRLSKGFELLSRPQARHRTLSAVASDCGFQDPSSFSRAFKAQFKLTPSEARGLAASGAGLINYLDLTADGRPALPGWLRSLNCFF